ncbi:MAG: 4-hydroxy-3-methylbut-2-enyl diphosphate reductase [Elusimicrobia bacterium]|nr:4-hydroxy-3-methylbut-2-enyl diphosphate reductase [Elusimicrobiota bacterium]
MTPESDVVLAKTAGFCPGVKKAIDRVLELAQAGKQPIFTLGPLIHNTQVIEMLEQKGIRAVDALDQVPVGSGVVVLRAHGVTPELEAEVRALGLEVVDATCPLVKHVQSVIRKYAAEGYATVIVGDKGHAEVTGLFGYAGENAYIVAGPEEALELPHFDKVNIVAQTTQEEEVFRRTAEVVRARSRETVVSNTICKPTRDRQRETSELAGAVDLMVIVGAKHSANTARLSALCKRLCPGTVHVETDEELDAGLVRAARRVAITAGASTPSWMTDRVLERVREVRRSQASGARSALERALEFLIDSCAYAGLSAVGLTYVCMKLQGCRVDDRLLVMAGLFVFSLHIINRVAQKGGVAADSRKSAFVQRFRGPLTVTAVASGLGTMGLALYLDTKLFAVVFLCWFMGALYPFRSLRGRHGPGLGLRLRLPARPLPGHHLHQGQLPGRPLRHPARLHPLGHAGRQRGPQRPHRRTGELLQGHGAPDHLRRSGGDPGAAHRHPRAAPGDGLEGASGGGPALRGPHLRRQLRPLLRERGHQGLLGRDGRGRPVPAIGPAHLAERLGLGAPSWRTGPSSASGAAGQGLPHLAGDAHAKHADDVDGPDDRSLDVRQHLVGVGHRGPRLESEHQPAGRERAVEVAGPDGVVVGDVAEDLAEQVVGLALHPGESGAPGADGVGLRQDPVRVGAGPGGDALAALLGLLAAEHPFAEVHDDPGPSRDGFIQGEAKRTVR